MATLPVTSDPFAGFMADFRARNEAWRQDESVGNYWEDWPVLDYAADLERQERGERDLEIARSLRRRLLATSETGLDRAGGTIDGNSQSYLLRLVLLLRQACADALPSLPPIRHSLTTEDDGFPGDLDRPRRVDPPPRLASRRALTLLAAPCAPPRPVHVLGVRDVSGSCYPGWS